MSAHNPVGSKEDDLGAGQKESNEALQTSSSSAHPFHPTKTETMASPVDDGKHELRLDPTTQSPSEGAIATPSAAIVPAIAISEDSKISQFAARYRCNRKRLTKVFLIRLAIRAVALVGVFFILKLFDYKSAVNGFLAWVDHFPTPVAALIFISIATIFVSIMPGSYASTVAAGAMFGIPLGATLGWLVMNLGALLNMFYIRKVLRRLVLKCQPCVRSFARFDGLDLLISRRPVHTTVLMRLPYLYSGILNYVFALSEIGVRDYALGNAMGYVPGSILFAALGQQARTLWQLVTSGNWNPSAIIILVVVVVLVISAIVGIIILTRRITKKEMEKEKMLKLQAGGAEMTEDDIEAPRRLEHQLSARGDDDSASESLLQREASTFASDPIEDGVEMTEMANVGREDR